MNLLIVRCSDASLSYRLMVRDEGLPAIRGELRKVGEHAEHRYSYPGGCGEGAVDAPDFGAAVEQMVGVLGEVELQAGETNEVDTVAHWLEGCGPTRDPVTRVDPGVLAQLSKSGGGPSMRAALATLEECCSRLPQARHVIVWDEAFFWDLPPESRGYLLPETFDLPFEVRRRGYRGLLHAAATAQVASRLFPPRTRPRGTETAREDLRIVLCYCDRQVGVTAVVGKTPIWTTFGVSPGDGLPGERGIGALPIGVMEMLLTHTTIPPDRLLAILRKSGGLGVGEAEEFEQVAAEASHGVEPSRTRFATFVREISAAIGAAATLLGGLDALVFIGARAVGSHRFRAAVCAGLQAWRVEPPADIPVPPFQVAQLSDDSRHPSVWAASISEDELIVSEVSRYLLGRTGGGNSPSSSRAPE